jgi:uncharacterized membrane protein
MTNDQYVLIGVVGLLIFSAIPITATAALYAGLFMLFVVWFSAYKNQQVGPFLQEMFKQGDTTP